MPTKGHAGFAGVAVLPRGAGERRLVDLELLEARWRTGYILASDLRGVARELAEAGHSAPGLADLLTLSREGLRTEGRPAFERVLRQLGRGDMTVSDAAMILARRFASELVAGAISPRAGSRAIALIRWKGWADVDDELEPFSELSDEYDALGAGMRATLERRRLDRRAKAEATRFLGP